MQLFIPGYGLMRQKLTAAVGREDDEKSLKPILVQFDDQAQIAFEVERSDDGLVAVFLPGAPDPWSGAAVFVTADRVFPVGVEVKPATKVFKRTRADDLLITNQLLNPSEHPILKASQSAS